jgi:iron complex outermembrane receptor protein
MTFQKSLFGFAVLSAMQPVMADEVDTNPIVVSSSRYSLTEYNAQFATEIYTSQDIGESGVTTLYDFLGQYTSINVLPSYGNPFAQRIDMRGYGIGNGYQNIAVTVNGRRLNNIDSVPQLLSAIPLTDIERIEIIKGSGSVQSGDGAMAGAIHIITRDSTGVHLGASVGGYGRYTGNLSAGMQNDKFSISATAEQYHQDGYSEADVTGVKDKADSNNLNVQGKYYPTDSLELRLGGARTDINTTYPGYLSDAQFKDNPAQNGGNTYTQQRFLDNNSSGGLTYDISPRMKLIYDQHTETKTSEYITYSSSYDYLYNSNDLAFQYQKSGVTLIVGSQQFDGSRNASDNTTSKNNSGLYVQSRSELGDSSLSAGLRSETVEYHYVPTSGTALSASHKLAAYDIGYNKKLDEKRSWFANYNHAFQAPDIDRFFNWGGTFNDFISPAISDTLNVGMSKFTGEASWKLSAFYSALSNEIYYNALTFTNTNIDKSHKYGLEGQYKRAITDRLSTKLNYTYTKATIDSENDGGGAYDGKTLPGVPEHSLAASFKYTLANHASISLDHTYRSEAYAANDFANSFSQKQAAYNVTNLGYRQKIKNTTVYARIENLFGTANGIWIQDDAIYPVNFRQTWQIGFNTTF